ncbi:hypothetical protein, partial [Falsiroseomonas sp.]|uniref:hypothetical protein n=1 Tax=Falsiroseomonas sp. TaxID=2870721 RepID=UPI0039838F9B
LPNLRRKPVRCLLRHGPILSILGASGKPGAVHSELDEQGLQIAALSIDGAPLVVSTEDVTICSPFWPHQPDLGRWGAHFVGLNAKHIPWNYYDRPATELRAEHWNSHRPELYARVGLEPPS